MMSYNQNYNTQPIYELDFNYSDNSDSDNNLSQLAYRSYLGIMYSDKTCD